MANEIFYYEQVWAASIAAHRVNGEYIKRSFTKTRLRAIFNVPKTKINLSTDSKLTNLALMKIFLTRENQPDITVDDYAEAETLHNYICSLTSLIFNDQARNYVREAVRAASLTEISIDGPELPLIASFPDAYNKNNVREDRRTELSKLENGSIPFRINDLLNRIEVVDCKMNKRFTFSPYAINAKILLPDGKYSMIHFFNYEEWKVGSKHFIMGNCQIPNETNTKLERVKKVTPRK